MEGRKISFCLKCKETPVNSYYLSSDLMSFQNAVQPAQCYFAL